MAVLAMKRLGSRQAFPHSLGHFYNSTSEGFVDIMAV